MQVAPREKEGGDADVVPVQLTIYSMHTSSFVFIGDDLPAHELTPNLQHQAALSNHIERLTLSGFRGCDADHVTQRALRRGFLGGFLLKKIKRCCGFAIVDSRMVKGDAAWDMRRPV